MPGWGISMPRPSGRTSSRFATKAPGIKWTTASGAWSSRPARRGRFGPLRRVRWWDTNTGCPMASTSATMAASPETHLWLNPLRQYRSGRSAIRLSLLAFAQPQARSRRRRWRCRRPVLLLWRFRDGEFQGPKVLVWHRGSFHTQNVHVHPCVNPQGTQIVYTADPQGYGQVFCVDVPEFDSLPDRSQVTRNKEV